jgi:hypothetical protein
LLNTTWYLGVPNNTGQTAGFLISATTLTNVQPFTYPAIVLGGVSAGTGGFTFTWSAVPGGQYEVQVSGDLIHWTQAANVTTGGYIGVYTDPAPISQQSARFYQVIRTQ